MNTRCKISRHMQLCHLAHTRRDTKRRRDRDRHTQTLTKTRIFPHVFVSYCLGCPGAAMFFNSNTVEAPKHSVYIIILKVIEIKEVTKVKTKSK